MKLNHSPNLKTKSIGTSHFLYDSLAGKVAKVPRSAIDIIEDVRCGKDISRHAHEHILDFLMGQGIIFTKGPDFNTCDSDHSNKQNLLNLRFHVSKKCNLDCDYCHVFKNRNLPDSKPFLMNLSTLRQGIDTYAGLACEYENPLLRFSFYGGEPLFNYNTVSQAVVYGNRRFTGKAQVEWILNTNGTLITPRMAEFFAEQKVDVHISIDGPDEETNGLRHYHSGRSVLTRVMESLDLLNTNQCSLQFDSCLTPLNYKRLDNLIDLAAEKGANRIYIAMTDGMISEFARRKRLEELSGELVRAASYGTKKGVHLGGPWKRAYSWLDKSPQIRTPIPHHVVDTSGKVYLSPFPDQFIGEIQSLKKDLSSSQYRIVHEKLLQIRKTCRGCDIEGVCNGYLKEMVRYHTGALNGHEYECTLAKSVFNKHLEKIAQEKPKKALSASTIPDASLLEKQLIRSGHLNIGGRKNASYLLSHNLTGHTMNVSGDTLEFLDAFKLPVQPLTISDQYDVQNLIPVLNAMTRNRFLINPNQDEEMDFLQSSGLLGKKSEYTTQNCRCFYSDTEKSLAIDFTHFIQERYFAAPDVLKKLRSKFIIFLGHTHEQIVPFWTAPDIPDWLKGFVSTNRILVMNVERIKTFDWEEGIFKDSMLHEIMHILLREQNVVLPVWLEEGICEYFSKPLRTSHLLHLAKDRGILSFKTLESLVKHTLLDVDPNRSIDNICYLQSQDFVAFLCRKFGETHIIECLLKTGLNSPFRDVFSNMSDSTLEKEEILWKRQLTS